MDFEVHGYTDGCKGCRWIQTGIGQPGHDEACRARMEDNLRKEEHPRFQRARDAREVQESKRADDFSKLTDEEMVGATGEFLRDHPQDEIQKRRN